MNREYWIKVFDRWLCKAERHVQNNDVLWIPSDSEAWASRSVTPAASSSVSNIIVAMSPQGGHASTGLDEKEHLGQYLVADPDACVLVGNKGTYFIPWSSITWVWVRG